MNILQHDTSPVHSGPRFTLDVEPPTFAPFDDVDEAWWAETSLSIDRPAPDLSDEAWLNDQALYHATRSRGEDVDGLVSCCLSSAARALRFHRQGAATYAARQRIDLDAVRAPGVGSRRSPLAADLDVETSWYLQLDTAAGSLAAYELQRAAELVERMGSKTVEDFLIDEAAWRAAIQDELTV